MKKRLLSLLLAVSFVLPLVGLCAPAALAATNTKSGTAADVVAVASAQKHGSSGSTYYKWCWGDGKRHEWCAAFATWCADQAGAADAVPKNGGCTALYADVIAAGGVPVDSPKPGDLIFYHKNSAGKNKFCHVGIVTKVSGSTILTVQGNVGDQVYNTIKPKSYQLCEIPNKNKVSAETYNAAKKAAYAYTVVYVRPNYNDASDAETQTGTTPSAPSASTPAAPTAPAPDPNGKTFSLVSKNGSTALSIKGSTDTSKNKANAELAVTDLSANNARFKFTKTSSGWYNLIPVSNSKLTLNPYSNVPKNGTNVNVYTKNASDKTQGWRVVQEGDYYVIRSAYNKNLVLTAEGTSPGSNVKLAKYTAGNDKQLWMLVESDGTIFGSDGKKVPTVTPPGDAKPVEKDPNATPNNTAPEETTPEATVPEQTAPVSGSTYFIMNKASGKALDVYGSTSSSTNKSNVHIYALTKSNKSSQFKLTKTAGGWFVIVPASNSKLAVNPYSDKPANGTNVNVYTKNTSDKTQGWIFEQSGDYYIIRSAYNKNLVLTAEGTSNTSNVKLAKYAAGNDKQLWTLQEKS